MKEKEKVCCPEFNPKPWQEKKVTWKGKMFLKGNVIQLFHIPLNFGQVITRMWNKIESAKASPKTKDFLMLAYDPSPWKSELYLSITKRIPGEEVALLSGTFLTKVFDGPYNAVPKWIKEMESYVKSKGETVERYFFYYTTCPKCAKKYGHNYVVVFAQLK